jgi:hypothetical protein
MGMLGLRLRAYHAFVEARVVLVYFLRKKPEFMPSAVIRSSQFEYVLSFFSSFCMLAAASFATDFILMNGQSCCLSFFRKGLCNTLFTRMLASGVVIPSYDPL